MTDDLPYSVARLAERWSCSEGLIRKLIKQGQLKSFRPGTLTRISAAEVARFEGAPLTDVEEWTDDDV